MMFFSLLINVLCNHSFAQMCLLIGIVSQARDVFHGPLVFFLRLAFWKKSGRTFHTGLAITKH